MGFKSFSFRCRENMKAKFRVVLWIEQTFQVCPLHDYRMRPLCFYVMSEKLSSYQNDGPVLLKHQDLSLETTVVNLRSAVSVALSLPACLPVMLSRPKDMSH